MKKILIFLSLSLISLSSVFAQENEAEINLTSADVKQFVDEFPALRKEFEELDMKYNSGSSDFTVPEGTAAMNKANTIVKKHGYADFGDFLLKTGAIVSSYAAIASEIEMQKAQPELEKAIAEIENNEHYSAEQKEQMKAMMLQSMEAVESLSQMASPENVAAVKPFVEDIERVLEED